MDTHDKLIKTEPQPPPRRAARVYPVPPKPKRWTVDHNGQQLAVEISTADFENCARLLIDGQPLDRQQASIGDRTQLQHGDLKIVVQWGWWPGQVRKCVLIEAHTAGNTTEIDETPFEPPPGTRAARLAQFQREHPTLYAARHVVIAIIKVVVPLLGIGALLTAVVPQDVWMWLEGVGAWIGGVGGWIRSWLPQIDLPFGRPAWIRYVIESTFFQQIKWVIPITIPIIVAISVAINEVERQRRRQQRKRSRSDRAPADHRQQRDEERA